MTLRTRAEVRAPILRRLPEESRQKGSLPASEILGAYC
jgi:hypothetical protein